MDMSLFLLAILLASPFPSLTQPSGKLGCRFSPICREDEVCAEDKLFGTCVQRLTSYLPRYELDPPGLKRLKDVVQYLLDEGFAWEDQYAQDSLQEVLQPFKQSIISIIPDLGPPGYQQNPPVPDDNEAEAWANVDHLAKAYQAVLDEYQDRYRAYEELVQKYGFGDDAELNAYAAQMQQKYKSIIRRLQAEERENLRKLYNLYYQKYLSLLEAETGGSQGQTDSQDEWVGNGGYGNNEDWKGLYKLRLLKEYLQLLYNENRDRWVTSSEASEDSYVSSSDETYPLETFLEEWNGDFDNELPIEDAVAVETGVAEPPYQTQEGEGNPYDVFDNLDGGYWKTLTAEEKNEFINEILQLEGDDVGVTKETVDGDREDGGDKEDEKDEGAETAVEGTGEDKTEAPLSKGQGVGEPGKEYVEPLKQPKDSGNNLDANLAKKDEDAFSVVTPEPAKKGPTVPPTKPTTSQQTTFAPSGYVFIALQSGISLEEAQMLVEELRITLDAPKGSFSEIETDERQVTFKVHPDVIHMTPAEVAGAAADHQRNLEDMMGVTITETGVGKQTDITVLDYPRDDNSTLIVVTVVLVACIVGILIAVVTVYCYRQKARVRAKLKGLASNGAAVEGEATADYQDLCRQRMASKSSEKPEPLSRISSVAMSEGANPSPSSRSSTSSWSEEPVQSNMDISTGHIVLSYMEDHLRNKDRITKEWEALCRYEPDISSTEVGALAINVPKNRYQDVLPYDHTRVLLNDSTNAQSSDYINASTIADADPRNPAYIATQAPLTSTIADFWQMVWEQGVVVIVNLTPMTDADTVRTLYWPSEGGTRYHFYEVHLVSEHVWCDDYLVRSFYLKNTETQETRTVTQFHFLTWPENGIPPSPKALLEFRRKVNKSYRGKACPIVVHCSDGVGRTGTYCLVDMVLTRMTKGAKEIDIAATLEHIRDQRPGAVKLKEQFEFALTALAEEVNAILKALPQ
ncbi:receptor-type tyrosine-protein phosphatase N2-like [Acanthaster planci]|uniref:Receptor-type tyrosine-protein phosphatase N2-like n=1 Tax=Acanthaster planci TaxID=133434 RepID=A0A8B7XGI7_ACAPL|nr:receptor-type tyrosine-protein phosphatase N2-like [Acanthaster planci]